MYISMYTGKCTLIHSFVRSFVRSFIHLLTYSLTHSYVHACLHTCACIYIYIYIYIYMFVCLSVCTYMYICIYIYIHSQLYTYGYGAHETAFKSMLVLRLGLQLIFHCLRMWGRTADLGFSSWFLKGPTLIAFRNRATFGLKKSKQTFQQCFILTP